MNSLWETLAKNAEETLIPKNDDTDEAFALDEPESEPTDIMDIQPKLEVVIIDEIPLESEEIVEFLDDDIVEEENGDDDDGDDVTHRAESEEDEQFIQTVQDFIKTVKPTQPSKLKRIKTLKRGGKLLSAKNARIMAADSERLNFRSTSCPHSSQKLKKDNKWWRLMHDCNYCDAKDFLTVEAINKHLKLHHAELVKVSCDICKKSYSEVSHEVREAPVVRIYRNFFQLKYLRKHMKYVHQKRNEICPICQKSFYYNYNLKSHMQIHTNEKTSICHSCGKFFTAAALHKHLKTGVNCAQERPPNRDREQIAKNQRYYCHICVPAKRFNLCAELTEHRRLLHNDFECPICRGWFSCTEALQNHLKTHSSKERKHRCTVRRDSPSVETKL